ETYGFCAKGEGGPSVESGAIRYDGGSIPVNTHGGQLSEAYIIGMTHIMEGVEQMRGTAINQVADADLALVTGGPASLPVSGLILWRAPWVHRPQRWPLRSRASTSGSRSIRTPSHSGSPPRNGG